MSRLPENLAHHLMVSVQKPELDINPAYGAMLRMQIIAQQASGGKNELHSATESPSGLFDKFLRILARIDAGLLGDSPQRVGAYLGGTAGDNKGSTAARPTKDAVYLNSGMADLRELFEIWDLLQLSLADTLPGDMKASMAAKREEMFTTWQKAKASDPGQRLGLLSDLRDKLKEAKEAVEKEQQKQLGTRVTMPLKFSVPGKTPSTLKYWNYWLKATNGRGVFYVVIQDAKPSTHKIFTCDTHLFPFDLMSGVPKDQILPTYLGGCTYEYVGDEGLRVLLPSL